MFTTIGQYGITCFLPEHGEAGQAVYLHTAAGEAEDIWECTDKDFALIAIDGIDWNRDLSPWHHEKVFAKGEDFPGGAEEYLTVLTQKLMPEAERAFSVKPAKRHLVGYSLGGLFAVYAMYHTAVFDGIGSISGSLWYDGFSSYVKENVIKRNPDTIYFSLGDKEAASACGIMQTVFVCTKQIEEKFRHDGIKTVFEMNKGNHFHQVPERIAKGICWLCREG